jgi:hypothetical protein
MKKLLFGCLAALLAGCHQPAPVDVIAAAEAQADHHEAQAIRLDSTAARYYALGRAAEDSATFYHLQSAHVQATPTAVDTAALRRFFADYTR